MADAEEAAPAPTPAVPGPAPAPVAAEPKGPFDTTPISTAHVASVWAAETSEEAVGLIGRCLQLDEEFADDLRTSIWVDTIYQSLDFCKQSELTTAKALAFLRVMVTVHAHAVDTMCSRDEAFRFFTEQLLATTKALPIDGRFSLAEVQLLTDRAVTSYLSAIKLHQLVFTEEQTVRMSHADLFLQVPAVPPATSDAVDPDSLQTLEAEDTADAEGAPAADAEGVPPAAASAPAANEAAPDASSAPPALDDEALTAAIGATISAQLAAHQSQMMAEYAAEEQRLLDRIGALEMKLTK